MKPNDIRVNKDDLREVLYEYIKSDRATFSNMMGSFKDTLDTHTIQLTKIETTLSPLVQIVKRNRDDIESLNITRASQSGGGKALSYAANFIVAAITALAAIWVTKK